MHLIHFHFPKREITEQRVNTASAVDITNTLVSGDSACAFSYRPQALYPFSLNQPNPSPSTALRQGNFQTRVTAVNLTQLKAWGFDSGICFTARYVTLQRTVVAIETTQKKPLQFAQLYYWPICC